MVAGIEPLPKPVPASPFSERLSYWAFLFFLLVYLTPVYLILLLFELSGGFQAGYQTLERVMRFVIADEDTQSIFTKILLPLLIGLSSAPLISSKQGRRMLTIYVTFFFFILTFAVNLYLLINISDTEIKELLTSRDIDPEKSLRYLAVIRESIVNSITILLGITIGSKIQKP